MSKFQVSILRPEPELHEVDSLAVAGELLADSLDACAVVRGPGSYSVANRLGGHSTRTVEGVIWVARHYAGCSCSTDDRAHFPHMSKIDWDRDYNGATGIALHHDGSIKRIKARRVRPTFPNHPYYETQRSDGSWHYEGGSLREETVVKTLTEQPVADAHTNFLSMLGAE